MVRAFTDRLGERTVGGAGPLQGRDGRGGARVRARARTRAHTRAHARPFAPTCSEICNLTLPVHIFVLCSPSRMPVPPRRYCPRARWGWMLRLLA